jgi:hypothetical protein
MKKLTITRKYSMQWPSKSQQGFSGLTIRAKEPEKRLHITLVLISGILSVGFFSSLTILSGQDLNFLLPLFFIAIWSILRVVLQSERLMQPQWRIDVGNSTTGVSLSNLRKAGKC